MPNGVTTKRTWRHARVGQVSARCSWSQVSALQHYRNLPLTSPISQLLNPPPPPTPCPPHLVLPGNPSSIPIPILGPLTPTPLRPYTILLDFSGSTLQCGPRFCNHTLGYGDRGPKSYPWLRKMGQNKTLDSRKCHQINHFWSNFARNWSNLAQILSFASKKWWNWVTMAKIC